MDSSWLPNLSNSGTVLRILVLLAVLLVICVVFGVVMVKLRRHYLAKDQDDAADSAGFSIENLESMRAKGHISDEEFRRLRRVALGLDSAQKKSDNTGLTPGRQTADGNSDTPRP